MHPLRQAIEKRGHTVNSIAARAGVPASTIYNVTRGRGRVGNMGIDAFRRVAHALGMTIDELLQEIESEE